MNVRLLESKWFGSIESMEASGGLEKLNATRIYIATILL